MKTNLLIFGTKNFNNTLDEIKEDLGFSFIYNNNTNPFDTLFSPISAVIVEHKVCEDDETLSNINKILNMPVLLLENSDLSPKCKYTDKIYLPASFFELKNLPLRIDTTFDIKRTKKFLLNV